MWVQAGFSPELFWNQTPRLFQLAMEGVRKRLDRADEASIRLAWHSGMFAGLASVGKLKPLRHYVSRGKSIAQTPQDMLAVLRSFQARGAKMTIERVKLNRPAAPAAR